MRVVAQDVNQIPNEEPKVDHSSSGEDETEPHVIREPIGASEVEEHQHWHQVDATDNDVATGVFTGEHVIVENDDARKHFIDKGKAQ